MSPLKVAFIFGTRPEAIKLAPVYLEFLKKNSIKPILIITSQHIEMLNQVIKLFSIKPDYDLKVMFDRQTLSQLTTRIITGLDEIFSKEKFDLSIVQGDTTSVLAGALTSFYHNIPVGHVEAGLRSFDMYNPFPEEVNRKLTSSLATLHFAPTKRAKLNLLREGVEERKIHITGNTVVDALQWIIENKAEEIEEYIENFKLKDKKYIYMTMHRRENLGNSMVNAIKGIKKFLNLHHEYSLIFPVHLNPAVRKVVFDELKEIKNVILIDPVNYLQSIALIKSCDFVLTDSGGLQEEAPTLGKPCLIMRKTTERPEAIEFGVAKLIGTSTQNVFKEVLTLAEERKIYNKMSKSINPFGNGNASKIISNVIENF